MLYLEAGVKIDARVFGRVLMHVPLVRTSQLSTRDTFVFQRAAERLSPTAVWPAGCMTESDVVS